MATSVTCFGFMTRATMSSTIPTMTNAMPEKNAAVGTHQYQGNETGRQPLTGQYVDSSGPPIRPSINRKIPITMSANPKV